MHLLCWRNLSLFLKLSRILLFAVIFFAIIDIFVIVIDLKRFWFLFGIKFENFATEKRIFDSSEKFSCLSWLYSKTKVQFTS